LFPSFGNILIFTTFKINQDEIAKTICVQRKFANNTCQGHCALKKSLKKLDENERKMNTILKGKIELVYIKLISENQVSIAFEDFNTSIQVFHTSKKPISKTASTFRPPAYFI
jgi:hypothetical protein